MSAYIQQHEEDFVPFVRPDMTVPQFCKTVVESPDTECGEIHIIALTRSLDVGIRIQYLDASPSDLVTHCYHEDCEVGVVCTLLFKPGHYDLLCEEDLPPE